MRFRRVTVGFMLNNAVLGHAFSHGGEIACLKGLQGKRGSPCPAGSSDAPCEGNAQSGGFCFQGVDRKEKKRFAAWTIRIRSSPEPARSAG